MPARDATGAGWQYDGDDPYLSSLHSAAFKRITDEWKAGMATTVHEWDPVRSFRAEASKEDLVDVRGREGVDAFARHNRAPVRLLR